MEPVLAPKELVRRIEAGDGQAEGEMVALYGEGLAFLLKRWTRDREAAADLYQETFRTAIEKIRRGEVRDPERLPAFLRSLARNLSIDYYRRHSRRGERESPLEKAAEPADLGAEPLGNLLRQERINLARRLLEELPLPRDREILRRFYIQEEDRERIRDDLGLSRADFNMILFRARRRYQQLAESALGERRVS